MPTNASERGKGQQGFTLIELAIVIIIIGLIIGAVIKGQDLIVNARAKRVANFMRQAEVAVWTHYDRMGYFPGDSQDQNGNLAQENSNFYGDLTGSPADGNEDSAGIEIFEKSLALGSTTFNVGMDMYEVLNPDAPMLCIVTNGEVFSEDQRYYGRMFDIAIDGKADGSTGKVIAMSSCGPVAEDGIVACSTPVQDWNSNSINGFCYFFDNGKL